MKGLRPASSDLQIARPAAGPTEGDPLSQVFSVDQKTFSIGKKGQFFRLTLQSCKNFVCR
jgi:hypothetical protein